MPGGAVDRREPARQVHSGAHVEDPVMVAGGRGPTERNGSTTCALGGEELVDWSGVCCRRTSGGAVHRCLGGGATEVERRRYSWPPQRQSELGTAALHRTRQPLPACMAYANRAAVQRQVRTTESATLLPVGLGLT